MLWTTWDRRTQSYHAGQDAYGEGTFIEDFSLDVNGLGVPESGAKAMEEVCLLSLCGGARAGTMWILLVRSLR